MYVKKGKCKLYVTRSPYMPDPVMNAPKPDVNKPMFWSMFAFPGLPARELASIVCDDHQGDLVYSTGPHGNLQELYLRQGTKWRQD